MRPRCVLRAGELRTAGFVVTGGDPLRQIDFIFESVTKRSLKGFSLWRGCHHTDEAVVGFPSSVLFCTVLVF